MFSAGFLAKFPVVIQWESSLEIMAESTRRNLESLFGMAGVMGFSVSWELIWDILMGYIYIWPWVEIKGPRKPQIVVCV